MTFLAANCKDGIVLLADNKSIIIDPSQHRLPAQTILGASGKGKPAETIEKLLNSILPGKTAEHDFPISVLAKNLVRLNKQFDELQEFIELLVVHSNDKERRIQHIDRAGNISNVTQAVGIGDGSAYAFPFLMQYYSSKMSMREFAELGFFILQFIEDYYPGKNGRPKKKNKPTIAFLPFLKAANYLTEKEILALEHLTKGRLDKYKQDFRIDWIKPNK